MSKGLVFDGSYHIAVVVDGEYVRKVRLPEDWSDRSFYGTTFIYERVEFKRSDDTVEVYFNIYPDDVIHGDEHKTDKKKGLTRITKDGYLILPEDLVYCAEKNHTDEIFFFGKGTYFEIRFDNSKGNSKFCRDIDESAAKFLSIFDK